MTVKTMTEKKYFEVKPGFHALSYIIKYGYLMRLAKKQSRFKHRMFGDISSAIDRHCIVEGQFEKGVIDLLRDLVGTTGHTELMIDVGANIGNHSIGLSDVFARTEAVEPHPVIFRILEANVIRNNIGTITCNNFGLASENAFGELVESNEHHGLAHIENRSVLSPEVFGIDAKAMSSKYTVELRDSRTFVEQFGKTLDRTFIKIDVEGMEEEIVQAILPLLTVHKPILGFEWFVEAQPKLEEIARSVQGYALYGITPYDLGSSLPFRALKMLFAGRTYTLDRLDQGASLAPVYPLALMIPEDRISR